MRTQSRVLLVLVVSGVMLVALLSSHTASGATGSNAATYLTLQTAVSRDPVDVKPEEARQVLIRGQVLNGQARLRVQVVGRDGLVVDETRTDPEGRFYFSPLPAGHYTLQVLSESGNPLALEPAANTQVWPEHAEMPIEYILPLAAPSPGVEAGRSFGLPGQAGAQRPDILQASGVVTGVITTANTGLPYYNVLVQIYNNTGQVVAWDYPDFSTAVYSSTVPPGTYRVYFEPYFGDYAPEWYDNQRDFASATPVVVGDGAIVSNINAALDVGGQIGGRVTAASGGAPISSVHVRAYTSVTSTSYVESDYTDATGVYTITGLSAGTYYLEFKTPFGSDYLSEYYNNKLDRAAADGVAVTLGGVVGGIDAALEVGGKIAGRVTGTGGTPVESVSVQVYTSTTATNWIAYDYTDASGMYTVPQLLAGTYYVRFSPPYASDYLEEFFNNKRSLATADPVAVTLGHVTGGIDAALEVGGKIAGRVTGTGGTPVESVSIQVYTSTTATYPIVYDYTDASGMYTVPQLLAGNYYVRFSPPYASDYFEEFFNNKRSLATADPVAVTLGNVRGGINAALEVGGKIAGRVTGSGGIPLQSVYVYVYTSTTATTSIDYGVTNASGVYTITPLLAGTYYIRFEPYGSDYLGEYYNDKSSLATANAIPVSLNTTVSHIDAALASAGKITGMVTAADGGAPLPDVYVTAYGYDQCNRLVAVAYATTNASGIYTVTGLLTGNYRVRFAPYSSGPSAAYFDEYYNDKPSLDTANNIAVVAGSVKSGINAVLQRSGQITGRVTAADGGAPLDGVWIDAYNNSGSFVASDYTDATGVYTLTGLTSGSYRLQFDPSFGAAAAYLMEYYNNKSTWASADPVNVTVGSVTGGINAVLNRGAQITGRITAADGGAPLPSVRVYIYNSTGSFVGSVSSNISGVYTTTGLTTGNYRLRFRTQSASAPAVDYIEEYYNDKSSLTTADPIGVTAPNVVAGINAVLARGGQITGTVTAGDTGMPLAGVEADAYNAANVEVRYDYSDSGGHYAITGLPTGLYHVRFYTYTLSISYVCTTTLKTYAGEYYNDKPDLATADNVSVTAPNATGNINAVLDLGSVIVPPDKFVYLPLIRR